MMCDIKKILKFLFPEYQIIACIMERGLWESKKPEQRPAPQHENIDSQVQNEKLNTAPVQKPNPYEYHVDAFEGLPEALGRTWAGSEQEIAELCRAFQRPYVKGFDSKRPKNAILILGHESRGKVFAVSCISKRLKKVDVFRGARISLISMSDYAADSSNSVFLSDLYMALLANTESIVFEDIDKASLSQLDIIYHLMADGVYKLPRRYMRLDDGKLVEATGILTSKLVSYVEANGKFFIMTSVLPRERIVSILGNKITRELGDVISLEPLGDKQVRRLTGTLCRDFVAKCKKHLQLDVECDALAMDAIGKEYNIASGVKGLREYIEENLYEAIAEMKLQQVLFDAACAKLTYDEGYKVILSDGNVIGLASYLHNAGAEELAAVKKELAGIIGLTRVKEYILNIENNFKVQRLRQSKGLKTSDISMHMIFVGNPGTGKTTIARIIARYLKAIGVLSSGHLCEVTRADLVGQYVGHTAEKTTNVIRGAIGGVLFIDEAYSLCRDKSDSFGLEAIDALVKGMEDNRRDLVVILAGYEDEMKEFVKVNSGMESRFPNIIHFEDYTPDEMCLIAQATAKSKGYKIGEDCEEGLKGIFAEYQGKGKKESGNGRLVRNIIEKAVLVQSKRVVNNAAADMELLTPFDFGLVSDEITGAAFDLDLALSKVIGLDSVKQYIRSLSARLKLQTERKKAGLQTNTAQTMHMIFAGNPGTGKTMMARLVANVLYNMKVINSNRLVETDRSGLVAGYVGQTAIKTREVVESALGGVLFIDEAYALAQGGPNDFGQEAIDTLVKMMDDNRDRLVVILAGYSQDMKLFLDKNAGLRSRFANIIEFPDYTLDELMLIAAGFYSEQGYILSEGGKRELAKKFASAKNNKQFGNGRYVRNVFERSLNNQALRLSSSGDYSREALVTITEMDIKGA